MLTIQEPERSLHPKFQIKLTKITILKLKTEIEAAAFRGLIAHLQKRTDAQNIDIMNLAGFCRNCLSKWYLAAAKEKNVELTMNQAREVVYGMPYDEWKEKHQTLQVHLSKFQHRQDFFLFYQVQYPNQYQQLQSL